MAHTEGMSGVIVCSARGCRRDARWQLVWRNPKLHDEDRRKIWTACDEHRATLGEFLSARGFLRDVLPLESSFATGPATGTPSTPESGPATGTAPS